MPGYALVPRALPVATDQKVGGSSPSERARSEADSKQGTGLYSSRTATRPGETEINRLLADSPRHPGRLQQVLQTVADEAPNAEIIVIAYPNLFADDTSAQGCVSSASARL